MRIDCIANDILLIPFICILPVWWLKHLEDFLSIGVYMVNVDTRVSRHLLTCNIRYNRNLWHILCHLNYLWLRENLLSILLRRHNRLSFIVERLLIIEVTQRLTWDWSVPNDHLVWYRGSLEIVLLRRNTTLVQVLTSISHSILGSKLLNLRGTLKATLSLCWSCVTWISSTLSIASLSITKLKCRFQEHGKEIN